MYWVQIVIIYQASKAWQVVFYTRLSIYCYLLRGRLLHVLSLISLLMDNGVYLINTARSLQKTKEPADH